MWLFKLKFDFLLCSFFFLLVLHLVKKKVSKGVEVLNAIFFIIQNILKNILSSLFPILLLAKFIRFS